MKFIRHYFTDQGKLEVIDKEHPLLKVKWFAEETLKVEFWPRELKIGPCRKIPYDLSSNSKKKQYVKEIIKGMGEYRARKADKATWPNQTPLIRVNETRTPYSEEFTRHDDARNRAHLSKSVPKRRKDSEDSSPQTDAPF